MKKLLTLSAFVVAASSFAVTWTETEPNDTWLTPNTFSGVAAGDNITGVTTGSSLTLAGIGSADHFRINTAATALGVWRNRLTIDAPGHTGALVGRTTTSATSSTAIQSSSTLTTPARMNQWYSFGGVSTVDYKVTGVSTTTAGYSAVMTQDAVSVTSLGSVLAGLHSFGTLAAGTSDTEIFLLDINGNILQQNDDTAATGYDSKMQYNLVAGQTYYIGVGRFNTAGNLQTVLGAGNNDELGTYSSGSFFTGGGMLASGSNTAGNYLLDMDGVQVGSGTFVSNTDAYRVDFYSVQAVPEPTSMAALGLGALAMLRRRKSAK